MASPHIIEIESIDFEERILKEKGCAILDFYSDECAPCESLAPKYEEIANLFGDQIHFYKIFRQKNRELSKSLGVSSSPTVIFYKDGIEVAERLTGGIKKRELLDNVKKIVAEDVFNKKISQKKAITKEVDVAILGGGPAGLTAAIYASQAKLKTAIIDSELTGGQVKITHLMSNYPGTGKPIGGYELMHNMLEQAKQSGTEIIAAVDVSKIELSETGGLHKIILDGGDITILAKSVILSTGAKPRLIGAPGEKEYRGQGISYCATCDGKYYDNKEVVVIGGGNSAVEESIFLTKFASKVIMVQNLPYLTANKTAIEHAQKNEKISVLYEVVAERFDKLSDGKIDITIKSLKTGELQHVVTDGVFIFIGMIPNVDMLSSTLKKDNYGYIITNEDMETNLPGVYAVGDVRVKRIRQAATAVGDGCIAGVLVEKYLEEWNARAKRSN